MWRLTAPILVLFSVQTFASICGSSFHEVMNDYIAKCGGQAYSKCDGDNGLSQETLFQAAEAYAFASNKLLLVQVGADWCPPCRTMDRDMKANPDLLARIEKHFVYVKLNGDLSATRAVARKMNWNFFGLPSAALYDPVARKLVQPLALMAAGGTEKAVEQLEKIALKINPAAAEVKLADEKIGSVRKSLLDKPIVKIGNFGANDFTPSTQLIGANKSLFIKWMRLGISYYHAFHWVNAARAFNIALKSEPQNPVAKSLLAMALTEISMIGNKDSAALVREASVSDISWLDEDDKIFVKFAHDSVCLRQADACGIQELMGMQKSEVAVPILEAKQLSKPDYLSILAFSTYDGTVLVRLSDSNPHHLGTSHYLTHLYENGEQMSRAGIMAKTYAEAAPDSAHAQHMYGHVLPQLGKWNEALVQFTKAHQIHLAESATEGIRPEEDWHYSHNLDLLMATLIYLDKTKEAETLLSGACRNENDESCFALFGLNLVNGEYRKMENELAVKFKVYLNNPVVMNMRILAKLGEKDKAGAQALIDSLTATGDLNSSYVLFGHTAFKLLNNPSPTETLFLLQTLEEALKKPGFDSWSTGVLNSRALARVLQDNGKVELAEKIKKMSIAAHEGKVCKTTACRSN